MSNIKIKSVSHTYITFVNCEADGFVFFVLLYYKPKTQCTNMAAILLWSIAVELNEYG